MEIMAALLGGLGLFFLGIRAVGQNLQALAGPRLRRAVARVTAGPIAGSAIGLLLGALTQSSNAVTFIIANMQGSGLISVARALPVLAWANVGTALLVLAATLDLRLAALLLLGVTGCMTYSNLDGRGRWRPGLGAAVGVGLMFLGLALVKSGAGPLRELALMRDLLALAAGADAALFATGAVVTLLAQSSSTVAILGITLHKVGLLGFEQTAMLIYGATLGSGLATYALSGGLAGSTRQLVLYQVWFKALGAALFVGLHLLEAAGGPAPLPWLLGRLASGSEAQLGLLFALVQVLSALLIMPLHPPLRRLLARLARACPEEELARPQYLYDQALADAPSALTLVEREQNRLIARLPLLLDGVREEAPAPRLSAPALAATAQRVEEAVQDFLMRLLAQGPRGQALAEAVRLEARLRQLRDLRATTAGFAATVAERPGQAPLPQLTEALHLLLEQLAEAEAAEDRALLLGLTEDRAEMMRRLRAARAGDAAPDVLHRATAGFERAVWLIRSILMLDQEGASAPGRVDAARRPPHRRRNATQGSSCHLPSSFPARAARPPAWAATLPRPSRSRARPSRRWTTR